MYRYSSSLRDSLAEVIRQHKDETLLVRVEVKNNYSSDLYHDRINTDSTFYYIRAVKNVEVDGEPLVEEEDANKARIPYICNMLQGVTANYTSLKLTGGFGDSPKAEASISNTAKVRNSLKESLSADNILTALTDDDRLKQFGKFKPTKLMMVARDVKYTSKEGLKLVSSICSITSIGSVKFDAILGCFVLTMQGELYPLATRDTSLSLAVLKNVLANNRHFMVDVTFKYGFTARHQLVMYIVDAKQKDKKVVADSRMVTQEGVTSLKDVKTFLQNKTYSSDLMQYLMSLTTNLLVTTGILEQHHFGDVPIHDYTPDMIGEELTQDDYLNNIILLYSEQTLKLNENPYYAFLVPIVLDVLTPDELQSLKRKPMEYDVQPPIGEEVTSEPPKAYVSDKDYAYKPPVGIENLITTIEQQSLKASYIDKVDALLSRYDTLTEEEKNLLIEYSTKIKEIG